MTDISMDKFGVEMGGEPIRVFSEKRRIDKTSFQPVVVMEIGFTLEQLLDAQENYSDFGDMILSAINQHKHKEKT